MLDTVAPTDAMMCVPDTLAEDETYFGPDQLADARRFYDEQGYVVVRGLVARDLCSLAREAFDAVRQCRVPMLRQKNMRCERNNFDADGFLANPVFNVQDLGSRSLGPFRDAVLDILTERATVATTALLLDAGRTKLIQSMFFQAPAGTWAHQDSYYQDSAAGLCGCVAGWFALENIDADAGRFYVCPGSHRSLPVLRNAGAYNFATGHQVYRDAMVEAMRQNGFTWVAPFLAAGDVLFWNSLTVHGSLPASRPGVSRTSLTAHYSARAGRHAAVPPPHPRPGYDIPQRHDRRPAPRPGRGAQPDHPRGRLPLPQALHRRVPPGVAGAARQTGDARHDVSPWRRSIRECRGSVATSRGA